MKVDNVVSIGARAVFVAVALFGARLDAVQAAQDAQRGFSIFDVTGGCDHAGDQTPATISVKAGNKIVWWIANTCSQDQRVRLCAYKKDKSFFNPFKKCNPEDADIGKIFTVPSRQTREVKCKGKISSTDPYYKMIQVGSDIDTQSCPDPMPSPSAHRPVKIFTHVLDITIEP